MRNGVGPQYTADRQVRSLPCRCLLRIGPTLAVALVLLTPKTAVAEVIPSGTALEVRMSSNSGSRISHVGDPIDGVLLTPIVCERRVVVPAGTSIRGSVTSVVKFGLGFRHSAAEIGYRFDHLQLESGLDIPIDAALSRVDTAREHVDSAGRVHALVAGADFSSTLALYAWKSAMWNPIAVGPATVYKMLFLRTPDPEIYFPAGTEMILHLVAPVFVKAPRKASPPAPLMTPHEDDRVLAAIERLPGQWISRRSGQPADLLNIALLGSSEEIEHAFLAAGWAGTQRSCARSFWRTYRAVFERHGYPEAPMTTMLLDGRPPDLAFQKSLNTFVKRHHLRLWRTDQEVDGRDVWVGSATEDVGISFNIRMHRFTHFIDETIDNERTKVADDLMFTGCVDSASLIARPAAITRYSGPSRLALDTDGGLAALRLGACSQAREVPKPAVAVRTKKNGTVKVLATIRDEFLRANFISLGMRTFQLPRNARSLLARKSPESPRYELTEQQISWMRPANLSLTASTNAEPHAKRTTRRSLN